MVNKTDFNHFITQDILQISNIVNLLDDAARTERFISKPKGPSVPSMYDVLITSYDKSDIGYYQKQIKLRATPRQITRWEFAIDILMLVDKDICDNPTEMRELLWMRAKKYKWTQLGRYFGYNRITIKNKYMTLLGKIVDKAKKQINFDILNRNLYLIS